MKDWHKLKPELFRKQPYYLPGCDSYAQKAWDWAYLLRRDGAKAAVKTTVKAAKIILVHDPFEPADKAHAARITGTNVHHFHLDHMGHRAVPMMRTVNALQMLINQVAQGAHDLAAIARALRPKRADLGWQRAITPS